MSKKKRRLVAANVVEKAAVKIIFMANMRPDAMEGISKSKWLSKKKRRLVAANVVDKTKVKIIFMANMRPDAMKGISKTR